MNKRMAMGVFLIVLGQSISSYFYWKSISESSESNMQYRDHFFRCMSDKGTKEGAIEACGEYAQLKEKSNKGYNHEM